MIRSLTTVFAFAFLAGSALAAGGGGTTTGGGSTTTPPPAMSPMKCKTGEVAKTVTKNGKKVQVCVKVSGSNLDDRDLYHQGWVLAKAGDYDWAIQVLSEIKNQQNPDVLTMLGYSNRKAGRFDVGFNYYQQALALDPHFIRAREYWGEGLVAQGKIADAKFQLEEIRKVSGTRSEEYKDLSEAIAKAA